MCQKCGRILLTLAELYGKLIIPLLQVYFLCNNFLRQKREANFNGGADMRVRITLACTECKQRNYDTKKNKKNTPDRVELKKYCRFCKKHTLHRETK